MTKFRNSEKATKKEVREALMSLAAESTPNRFNVRFDSDGSGACVILMVERDSGEDSNGKNKYIDVFYDADGNYKVTADA